LKLLFVNKVLETRCWRWRSKFIAC